MTRNRMLVGGLVIVAALVIAYFAFLYPPVSKENTSGAIGVANKYRNEQITDKDVLLKSQEDAAAAAWALMSPDEKAAMFDRTSRDLQARVLNGAPAEMTSKIMERSSNTYLAKTFKGLDAQSRVEVFERAPKPVQDAVLRTANVTSEAYSKMTVDERSIKVIGRASDTEMAAMAKNLPPQERFRYFFEKADPTCKSEFVALLDRTDKIAAMERTPIPTIAEMGRVNFAADYFGKTAPEAQFEMLGRSPEIVTAVMGRADNVLLAKSFRGLDAQGRVDAFERAPKPVQDAVLRSANVTSERYAKMTVEERATKVLGRASDMQMAAVVKNLDPQEKSRFLGKADPALRSSYVALLDRGERATLMGRAPVPVAAEMERQSFAADYFAKATPAQQFEMLGKSPDAAIACLGRANDALLAKTFKGLDAQSRVEVFERAPRPVQDAVLRTANVTSEAYSKMTVDEKTSRVIGRASDTEMAAMAKNLPPQERFRYFFEKADPTCKSEIVTLLDRTDRVNLMGYAPAPVKADMERSYTDMERTAKMKR